MRYVKVQTVTDPWPGYSLDADEYVAALPQIQAYLPEGARAFALDKDHYNFFGSRCVKDLKLTQIQLMDAYDRVSVEIDFAPNEFKHDSGLTIQYTDVTDFSVDVTSERRAKHVWPETRRLGDFQLDEILPHEKGCSHEIQMTGGSIRIVCADLVAEWGTGTRSLDTPESNNEHAE